MTPTPTFTRITDYLPWLASVCPDRDALILGEDRRTFGAVQVAVDDLARALLAAGVRKGDRVATLQTPHPDYLISFLATASIGAIWVGLNPRYQLAEMRHVMTDAQPAVLLTRTRIDARDYEPDLQALAQAAPMREIVAFAGDPPLAGVSQMQDFIERGRSISDDALAAARAAVQGDDGCLIVYTSGSTGAPKGALLGHQAIVAFCLSQNRVWPITPLRTINYFPINHIGCVIDISLPCLLAQGSLFFMEQFDPEGGLALIEREKITLWGSVPSVFEMQLGLPTFDRYDLSSVQMIVWEGAAMNVDLIERLRVVQPLMATNYSMTETLGLTAVEPTDDLEVLSGSVGSAFPEVELRLVDAEGRDVPDGEPGEVLARSPFNLIGYWNRPDATSEAFTPDGFFRTGDLALRRADGRYRIIGRLKEMYKSGGYNVYPREVETVIEAHPLVAQAAVVSAPDPLWQEIGVAFVQPAGPLDLADLESHCRAHLANYKIPKRFVLLEQMPLLPIGKIDKVTLAKQARDAAS